MPIVRVAVLAPGSAGGRLTDMALPSGVPLREILPAVQRMALAGDEPDGAPPQRLSLAPVGGAPFSLDATLDTVGVVDGDLLVLAPVPAGPPAPRIVEDIADAAVLFAPSVQRTWGPRVIARGAVGTAMALLLVATGLAVAHRILTGGLTGVFVATGVAVVAVLAALVARTRSAGPAAALSVCALAPVAAAFAMGVPGGFGAPNVLLAAAGVTAWSLIGLTLSDRSVAVFTATTAAAVATMLVAAAASVWTPGWTTIGCGLLLLGLVTVLAAPQLSATWARFPLPVIPAPGDPTPSAQPLQVLADLPRRVRRADAHQTGFIAAGTGLAVAGSVALLAPADASPWAWYLVAAAAAAGALRARVWDSTPCKAWLLAHPYLVAVALLVTFTATGRYAAAWWTLAALTVLVLIWAVAAAYPKLAEPETYSVPMRRLTGFLATGLDASLVPVMAYLVGLFSWVLDR